MSFKFKTKYKKALELVKLRITECEVMEEQCTRLAAEAESDSVEQKLNLGYAQTYKARKESYTLLYMDLKSI